MLRPLVLVVLSGVSIATIGCRDRKSGSPNADAGPRFETKGAQGIAPATSDLDTIRSRGSLRILVRRSEVGFLPRPGMPALTDIRDAESFADVLGVEPVFVLVDRYRDLIPALEKGIGDVIAAQLTVTPDRKKRVQFTRSTLAVDEVVVGRRGQKNAPRTPAELAGRTVMVRKSSAYRRSLDALAKKEDIDINIVDAPEHLDTEMIIDRIAASTEPVLTVVDSHLLQAFETYRGDVDGLFVLSHDREIAWAVRKTNSDLQAALDRFVIERAMTGDRNALFKGDLDAIKKRRVLRVLTRNNATSYFLYKGVEYGFDYELARGIADEMGVRLQMVVAPSHADLVPWLLEGRGDLIAAQFTATDVRAREVRFSRPYLRTDEVLVKRTGTPAVENVADLEGRTIHVRRSSSYHATLQRLIEGGAKFEIRLVDEDVETATLIQAVGTASIAYTIADKNLLEVEVTYGTRVEAAMTVSAEERAIAYAVRPNAEKLAAFLDHHIESNDRGTAYNIAKRRYFSDKKRIAAFKEKRVGASKTISRFDELIQKYAHRYQFDWRLMAAQAYVESGFDPNAKSWVGARGLFQVMPRTGQSMGFTHLERPAIGIHAGIKYMSRLMRRFNPNIPLADRIRLALAAYNVGLGHVLDARRLAKREGLDPNVWFGNVEAAMLLLAQPKYAKRARNGFCRGGQPVAYVAHIQKLYDAYVAVTD